MNQVLQNFQEISYLLESHFLCDYKILCASHILDFFTKLFRSLIFLEVATSILQTHFLTKLSHSLNFL